MTRIFLCALVLLATPLISAQQMPKNPPYTTPPTFPDNRPEHRQPPVLPEQQSQMSNADVQQQIQQSIAKDPALMDANVHAKVDDNSIVLTGTVEDEAQHRRALASVQPYAGQRNVIDKLVVKKTT